MKTTTLIHNVSLRCVSHVSVVHFWSDLLERKPERPLATAINVHPRQQSPINIGCPHRLTVNYLDSLYQPVFEMGQVWCLQAGVCDLTTFAQLGCKNAAENGKYPPRGGAIFVLSTAKQTHR